MNITYDLLDHGSNINEQPFLIVVHSMGEYINDRGKIYSARSWLDKLGYSAHALIHPDGNITVCRPAEQGAYHARGFNTNSLGVEFLVPGRHNYATFLDAIKTDWCTPAQYRAGAELINMWMFDYDIGEIKRHSDISPGRKVDPGTGFKWREFLETVRRT